MPAVGACAVLGAGRLSCEWVWFWFRVSGSGRKGWRRPTLPMLKHKYHRRCLVSRPGSGWDRVGHRRYGHQPMGPLREQAKRGVFENRVHDPCV